MVAILVGRPLVAPVDDIPTEGPWPAPLAELAEDFATHGYDLRRLITVIALSDLLGLDSRTEQPVTEDAELLGAVFPLTRLRPEQVVRSLLQAGSTTTLDRESWWLAQLISFGSENDFLKRYGDIGEDRFESSAGTLPQRLLLMNGKISRDRIKGELGLAFGQIAALSPTNRAVLDNLWLAVLTRRPTEPEVAHFLARIEGRRGKAEERELRGVRLRQGGLLEASAVVAAMGPWTCKLEDWAGVPVPLTLTLTRTLTLTLGVPVPLEGVWSTSLVYEGVTEPQP